MDGGHPESDLTPPPALDTPGNLDASMWGSGAGILNLATIWYLFSGGVRDQSRDCYIKEKQGNVSCSQA